MGLKKKSFELFVAHIFVGHMDFWSLISRFTELQPGNGNVRNGNYLGDFFKHIFIVTK